MIKSQGQLNIKLISLCFKIILINRRIQERDKQWLDRVQQEEEHQRQKKLQEDEKLKREEITKKKESEEKGKQDMQEKLNKLFQQHQEPAKPAVQAPWSSAGMEKQINPIACS